MAPVLRQSRHGGQRGFQPHHGRSSTDPAEVPGAYHRQQIEPHVGRRRAMGQDRPGVLLEIVRRQHVVSRGYKGFKEPPGSACDQAQRVRFSFVQRQPAVLACREADPVCNNRRNQPEGNEGCCQHPIIAWTIDNCRDRHYPRRCYSNRGRARHGVIHAEDAAPYPGGDLGGGGPLQQVAAADIQAP